jgi:hypothetical protein
MHQQLGQHGGHGKEKVENAHLTMLNARPSRRDEGGTMLQGSEQVGCALALARRLAERRPRAGPRQIVSADIPLG